ncbi:cheR methyltransferase, SAM binding domain protein [Burkholderia gladioli]|uniref:CheR methyltransferase, SAM binding domain protein n=2 Tax=Burkholderia gladioli TaxID=28095 RepID=A0AAW3F0H6_BURGA|nr:CheR family methyltransferase [Burkholderia gladioli]AJW96910.1 cheR methyltransferase, SAM binding domain protein [Burkholderia gladioli]ASD84256.1 MCP methyltransferase [Burkholderia gladioli pv. gladioli]AWY51679.1 MCP methyltransferase [Burkholderia gladioli pv. gladioli]KGC13325.1 cheR methyltransferase, SAM binding domain protein [Burkholderia gladioli]SPU89083.1 MCP methyltransferase, CheR-type [Burkholderia gladioli]
MTRANLMRIHDWLARETGIDSDSLGADFVARVLAERIAAMLAGEAAAASSAVMQRARQLNDEDIDAHWRLLLASADEQRALIEQCVVPETWFFREREAFVALAARALERLRAEPSLPLRVLSAPCSTGEEPYSAAMALVDAGIDPARLQIDALDISARAIAQAQRAEYGRNSFRGHALEFRARYFTPTADGWRLDARIRDCVRFRRANLLELGGPGQAADEGRYDFIFCRNVLIYFDRQAQERALRALDARLAEDGLLFVGPAETGVVMRQAMSSAKIPLAFAFRRTREAEAPAAWPRAAVAMPVVAAAAGSGTGRRHAVEPGPGLPPVGVRATLTAPAESAAHEWFADIAWPLPTAEPGRAARAGGPGAEAPTASVDGGEGATPWRRGRIAPGGAGLSSPAQSAPRGATATATVTTLPGRTGPAGAKAASVVPAAPAAGGTIPAVTGAEALETARARADAGDFAAAERAVLEAMSAAGPSAEAYYLLGLIADAQGLPVAAEHYRKALYLAPTHREALTHLATLLDIAGDHDGARWLKERARRAEAQAGGKDTGGRDHARRR